MNKTIRRCALLGLALAFFSMVLVAPRAAADIFETNNAGSCSGGGSAGGGLCYFNGTTYVPYSLSGLLSGAYGPITIGSGTMEYVVTDNIPGGSFSFTYDLTAFTSGTTPPIWANNVVCQVDGTTTADFAHPSNPACSATSGGATNTGTINSSGAFTTGAQINNASGPITITFYATNGYGATFDLGFVSMQNTGTIMSPEPSTLLLVGAGLLGLGFMAFRQKSPAHTTV